MANLLDRLKTSKTKVENILNSSEPAENMRQRLLEEVVGVTFLEAHMEREEFLPNIGYDVTYSVEKKRIQGLITEVEEFIYINLDLGISKVRTGHTLHGERKLFFLDKQIAVLSVVKNCNGEVLYSNEGVREYFPPMDFNELASLRKRFLSKEDPVIDEMKDYYRNIMPRFAFEMAKLNHVLAVASRFTVEYVSEGICKTEEFFVGGYPIKRLPENEFLLEVKKFTDFSKKTISFIGKRQAIRRIESKGAVVYSNPLINKDYGEYDSSVIQNLRLQRFGNEDYVMI